MDEKKKPVYVKLNLTPDEWKAIRYIARQNQKSVPKMIAEYIRSEVRSGTDGKEES